MLALVLAAAGSGEASAAMAADCGAGATANTPRGLVCEINRQRASHGLRTWGFDRQMARAARRHAHDMARRRYFAHARPGGPDVGARLARAGWRGHAYGEAIAYGCGSQASAASTVAMWLASPPHRAILLDSGFRRAGAGVARRAPCGAGATWVLDAGRR